MVSHATTTLRVSRVKMSRRLLRVCSLSTPKHLVIDVRCGVSVCVCVVGVLCVCVCVWVWVCGCVGVWVWVGGGKKGVYPF